ncbi:MAG: hypothetical protein IJB70_05770 [Clostridia bacterium]|nr:hypothetical protein [Clostridia bacterium]
MTKKTLLFFAAFAVVVTLMTFNVSANAQESSANGINYIFDDFDDGAYDDANSSFWKTQISGTCGFEVESLPTEDNPSNKVLVLNNPADSSAKKTNLYTGALEIAGDTYFEFDLCVESAGASFNVCEIMYGSGSSAFLFYTLNNDKTEATLYLYYGYWGDDSKTTWKTWRKSTGKTVKLGEWYNYKILIKPGEAVDDGVYSVWLNDELAAENWVYPIAATGYTKDYVSTFRWQFLQSGKMMIDNISIRTYPEVKFVSSYPGENSEPIHPSETLIVETSGFANKLDLMLNDSPVSEDSVTQNGNIFIIKPQRLSWDTEYKLSGTVFDMFGSSDSFEISFKTKPMEDVSVDIIGFTNENGEKLTSLVSGIVKANLIYEAKESDNSFTAIAGLFKEADGIVELVDIVSFSKPRAGTYEIVEFSLNVPEECENMFIDVYMWKSLPSRELFDTKAYYGKTRLE